MSGPNDPAYKAATWLGYSGILFLIMTLMPRLSAGAGNTNEVASTGASVALADETLLLEVEVNGHSIGKVGQFTLRDGTRLMARPEELRDLGFRVPNSLPSGFGGLIALSDLPGLTWSVDQKNQELHVTATDSSLVRTILHSNENESPASRRVIESGTGVTLNYDTLGTFAGGKMGATASLDLRGFSPWGIVDSGWLVNAGAQTNGAGAKRAIRLDSTYSFADVNTLRRYRVGDFITGGLAWTRPIRLAGLQVLSDFSIRPDLVTFPLPSISGSVAVPSTVDVLANGNTVVSSQVDAGPFEIPQLPVSTGAGTISMTVTDALGRQVNVTQPFYASSSLLAPRRKTFSVQAGLVRRNWGSISNDFGKIAGTAVYRRGLTRKFTAEGSIEGTPGTVAAGAGGVAQVGNLGILNLAIATSAGTAHPGAQFSFGAQRIGRMFSLSASETWAGRNFRDVAAMNAEPVPRKQFNISAGLQLRHLGSFGMDYATLDRDGTTATGIPDSIASQHSKVFSASYSIQVHRMWIYANEFRDLDKSGSNGVQFGFTIPWGLRRSAGVSGSSDGSGQIQAQQSPTKIGEWGYQAFLAAGNNSHEFIQTQYKSPFALLSAGIDRNIGTTSMRLESQGALSFVDRGLFASNTIYDSFAIVDTGSMEHVHVLQENRDVGRTNAAGRLLVPDMRSFDRNHLAIVATDVPPDATIAVSTREVRPQDRSGVVVSFAIKISHGALLQLVDQAGVPEPVGSTARIQATGAVFPVGYDGNVYADSLELHNTVEIERPDGGHCTAAFDYKPVPMEIPKIGPLPCLEEKR